MSNPTTIKSNNILFSLENRVSLDTEQNIFGTKQLPSAAKPIINHSEFTAPTILNDYADNLTRKQQTNYQRIKTLYYAVEEEQTKRTKKKKAALASSFITAVNNNYQAQNKLKQQLSLFHKNEQQNRNAVNFIMLNKQYKQLKAERESLEQVFKNAQSPGFFQALLSKHFRVPALITLFVATAIATYLSIAEILSGGFLATGFVLTMVAAQGIKLVFSKNGSISKKLKKTGKTIDDFIANFNIRKFWNTHGKKILSNIALIMFGIGVAAILLNFFTFSIAIPLLIQGVFIACSTFFVTKIAIHTVEQIKKLHSSNNTTQAGTMKKMLPYLGIGIILLSGIAEAAMLLGTALTFIAISASTTYLLIGAYTIYYFCSKQFSLKNQFEELGSKLDKLTWEKIYNARYDIAKSVIGIAFVVTITALVVFPPASLALFITSTMATLGITAVSNVTLAFVSIGVTSCIAVLTPKIWSGVKYIARKAQQKMFPKKQEEVASNENTDTTEVQSNHTNPQASSVTAINETLLQQQQPPELTNISEKTTTRATTTDNNKLALASSVGQNLTNIFGKESFEVEENTKEDNIPNAQLRPQSRVYRR